MKNLVIALLTIAFIPFNSGAQDMSRQVPCNNDQILHQADSIKKVLVQNGFILLKEASVTMESEYEIPVIIKLTGGSWYQFVFIGENSSKLYEVRMFDWNEKQVMYEKNKLGDVDANIISCSYPFFIRIPHDPGSASQ